MKRLTAWILLMVLSILPLAGCATSGEGDAKQQALQALVTTTRTAVLLMTAAGIAYDAGAFGAPGSAKAEETRERISAQSLVMHKALNEWQAAVQAGRDASAFASIVGQALAVIGALLPAATRAGVNVPPEPISQAIARLGCPDSFMGAPLTFGGAR
jgi:uncharacterized membrane protein